MTDIILTRGRPSPRQRRAMVLAMGRNRLAYEKWLSNKLVAADRDLKRNLLKDATDLGIAKARRQYHEALLNIFTRFYANIGTRTAQMMADDGKASPMEVKKLTQKELEERTRRFIEQQVGYRIVMIEDSTFRNVQRWYGQSQGDVAVFEELLRTHFSDTRSRRIAVTETTMAMNQSINDTAKELSFGRPMEKEWIASQMSNMREGHADADGQVRNMNDPYEVVSPKGITERLMFPTDSSLGASACNCVNCRCVSIPRYKD